MKSNQKKKRLKERNGRIKEELLLVEKGIAVKWRNPNHRRENKSRF